VDSREQVIQDRLNDINSVNSNNATNSFTLLASSNSKDSLDILSNNTTSFALLAVIMSSTLTVTLQAMTFFRVLATATSSTLLAAAMSFPLSVSNSCNKGPSDTKIKCAGKTGGIEFETKRLKQRREKNAGDRVHGVSRSQNPTLFRHKRIIQRHKTQYILPDNDVVYSSRAVTYLLEIAVARG
jgi:hypothetical protein